MSKLRRRFYHMLQMALMVLCVFSAATAQDMVVQVKLVTGDSPVLKVEGGGISGKGRNLFFSTEYAGVPIPGERILDLNLRDQDGREVKYTQLKPGEFFALGEFTSWGYRVRPAVSKNSDAAHVSWLTERSGFLMLDDLLPKFGTGTGQKPVKIGFDFPPGWVIRGPGKLIGGDLYQVDDVEKAVFFLGRGMREEDAGENVRVNISGEWRFKDEEAAQMAREIFAEYKSIFGGAPGGGGFQINLSKFPLAERFGVWHAETRGRTVTILSADMPFEAQSQQLLHEQLRHEIFHLWIPNGVDLSGNYDWFYEGFALYQALRTGMAVGRIRFEDFLDTLTRVANIDAMQDNRPALIDASKNRWAGSNTQVYARGMLVAFLSDVTQMRNSKNKTSVSDVVRDIYLIRPPTAGRPDANSTILGIFERRGLTPVVNKYIRGTENILWKTDLADTGIEAEEANQLIRLKLKAKPTGREKAFLDKLGYNNSRKVTLKSK